MDAPRMNPYKLAEENMNCSNCFGVIHKGAIYINVFGDNFCSHECYEKVRLTSACTRIATAAVVEATAPTK